MPGRGDGYECPVCTQRAREEARKREEDHVRSIVREEIAQTLDELQRQRDHYK